MKLASRAALWVGAALLVVGLAVVVLNSTPSSRGDAVLWLGVMAMERGLAVVVPSTAVAVDLAVILLCLFGLEVGGLLLVPAGVAFVIADVIDRQPNAR